MSGQCSGMLLRRHGAAFSVAVTTLVLVTGCNSTTDTGAGDAFAPSGTAQSGGTAPETVAASPSLPVDFPDDVAFPAGQYSLSSVQDDEDGTTVVLDGTFDLDVELAHLVAAFESAGYTVDQHTRAAAGPLDQLYLEVSGEEQVISIALIDRPEGGVATYEVTHQP